MCDTLVGYHAWSGNDYNPAMYRKGKVGPAKQMENDLIAQTAFVDLGKGSSPTLTPSVKRNLKCLDVKFTYIQSCAASIKCVWKC